MSEKNPFLPRKKILSIGVFLFLMGNFFLVSCLGPTKSQIRKARSLYRLGVQQSNSGNFRQALVVLKQAEELNPRSYWIQEAIGGTLMRMKRPELALKHFKKALDINPKSPRGWNNLGAAYMSMQRWNKAIDAFQMALKNILYQTPCFAQMNLGWAYHQVKKDKEALFYLNKATAVCPKLCQGHRLKGKLLFDLKRYSQAENSFKKLSTLCQKFPEGHFLLAQALIKEKKYEASIKSLRMCLKLSEKYPVIRSACRSLLNRSQTLVGHYVP